MAGPSGAGAVAYYLKLTRSSSRSAHREIRAARRREDARANGGHYDDAAFDCLTVCMSCGRLVEPAHADPMRSEPAWGPMPCPSCGERGLAALRHTPTAEALSALERSEAGPSRWACLGRGLISAGLVGLLLGATGLIVADSYDLGSGLGMAALALGPLVLISAVWLVSLSSGQRALRRTRPRRWQLPPGTFARRRPRGPRVQVDGEVEVEVGASELLRAPLSGRACVAYELGVRDDLDPAGALGSWRLLEQDNLEFRVGAHTVGRGQALLERTRARLWGGLIMSQSPAARRCLRIRGLLDSESVEVFETIVEAGDRCSLTIEADGLARVG